jgi:regulator of sigma E protease
VRNYRDINTVGREFLANRPVALALLDGRTVTLSPTTESYVDEITKERREKLFIGFEPDRRQPVNAQDLEVPQVRLYRSISEVVALSFEQLSAVIRLTVIGISRIVTGHISFKTVGGPIMLFQIASSAAEEGLSSFLFQMALISVNLGLMNLLPIPVLDGGHSAQALVETVTRRPLSMRAREIANVVGLVLLFTLMAFVFKNDIVRLIG